MNNKNNDLKPINFANLLKNDISKIDLSKIPIQSNQPTFNILQTPKINFLKKEEPKPKSKFEQWYDRNNGKITIFFAVLALVEGIIIFLLSI